jgi:hypothetical protein
MTLQKKTLSRYRQYFPNETLRETSARTGIQITRVFRLFGGKNMKVGELEAFEAAINIRIAENPSMSRLSEAVEAAGAILTNEELAKVTDYIQRKVKCRSFSRMYIRAEYNNASIA